MRKVFTGLLIAVVMISRAQVCELDTFNGPTYFDTYHEYFNNQAKWSCYNVHDPTVCKDGDWYYMYNTDVGLGYDPGTGTLKRRSQDLVNWDFLGQAFDGIPESAREFFLIYNPEYTDNGIWAPFLMRYKDEFRLYYSAPGGLEGENLAFIGWAISSSADGPWEDKGKITSSTPGDTINAIDPSVIIDSISGRHWMAYGSYENGLYVVELDSTTGGLKTIGDRGVRIAGRSGGRHRAIEGPEFSYRNSWYYLFVSYDWLEDYYNVRVGRSQNPNGPYLDINGVNMAEYSDNWPVIQKPYRFNHHEGWQGTGHCSVYNDEGNYFMFNQARPSTDIYNMVLHTRKIFWIDNWPVLSPERYAAVPQCSIAADSLVGKWEHMLLEYKVGILHSTSTIIELKSDGTIDGDVSSTWELQDSLLTLRWTNGETIQKTIVSWGWDWENPCQTILYTGMDDEGLNVWGKKINREAVDTYTKLVPGAAYQIRSHYSNMLIEVPDGADEDGVTIRQGKENGENYQFWRIAEANDGYWYFFAEHSDAFRVIEVPDGNPDATFLRLGTFTGEDKQKFKIQYKNDGYFKVFTKVSNDTKCFDLYDFSIEEGGFISQWIDLDGVNQAWRFKRIDSLGIDNTLEVPQNVLPDIRIYPNPFIDELHVDLHQVNRIHRIELIDAQGRVVAGMDGDKLHEEIISIPVRVEGNLFLLKIYKPNGYFVKKVIKIKRL
ncbi:MAG: family 43 glycosylhydrolase [Bacteroidales bacterium]|nr:family 43 glycosylhydrolase [Bacteroidales bacterium]